MIAWNDPSFILQLTSIVVVTYNIFNTLRVNPISTYLECILPAKDQSLGRMMFYDQRTWFVSLADDTNGEMRRQWMLWTMEAEEELQSIMNIAMLVSSVIKRNQ